MNLTQKGELNNNEMQRERDGTWVAGEVKKGMGKAIRYGEESSKRGLGLRMEMGVSISGDQLEAWDGRGYGESTA